MDTGIIKSTIWSISKICHYFINSNEDKTEHTNDGNEIILKSKLFSGGIQNRFLSLFSSEVLHTITSVSSFIGDNNILGKEEEVKQTEEDKIMFAIIHKESNEKVDLLIQLLEWELKSINKEL